uniref:TGF-beta family profile domain-containing protein n=1 Tax=Parascaris univalens TaxID=6257 RepID=A0A915ANK6_PARUN
CTRRSASAFYKRTRSHHMPLCCHHSELMLFIAYLCATSRTSPTCVNSSQTAPNPHRRTTETIMNVLEQQEIARMRRRILKLLELDEPPIIPPGEEAVAQYVAEIGAIDDDISDEEDPSKGQIQIYIAGKEDWQCSSAYWRCYRFEMKNSIDSPNMKIIDASLHLGRQPTAPIAKVEIFDYAEWRSIDGGTANAVLNLQKVINEKSHDSFDCTLPLIRISYSNERSKRTSPVVALKLQIEKSVRKRRSVDEDCTHGGCCLRSFYFNFSDNSWNKWIIKPEGYNMNYCSGHCQIGHQFDSARDVMATLARLGSDEGLSENPPCCTPTAYRSLKVHLRSPIQQDLVSIESVFSGI